MEKTGTVLLLCNDPANRQLYAVMLKKQGFTVVAKGLEYVFTAIQDVLPTIVLIDLDSQHTIDNDLDSQHTVNRQTLQLLRSKTGAPIICLLSASDKNERVMKSMKGVIDDFLLKPVRADEIQIRIQRILDSLGTEQLFQKAYPLVERRQNERRKSRRQVVEARGCQPFFRIDNNSRRIYLEGKPLNLTRKEYELFYLLVSNPGRVFSDEEILDLIWAGKSIAGESHVQQYIHRLRKKVEPDPCNPRWIITAKGFGYCLDGVEYQRKVSELYEIN